MNLKQYYDSLNKEGKQEFANRLNTSVAYLSQLANGHRNAGTPILLRIDKASEGNVSPQELRADLYESAA